jgi:hypothetical protein
MLTTALCPLVLQDVMGQKVRVIAEAAIKTQPKKKKSGFFS